MLLDEREIALLARFFAKRFPHAADRKPLLERAGLADSAVEAPIEAWEDIVARAQQVQGLPKLGRALETDDPDDVNLREVRHLLADDPRAGWSVPAAALGAASALAIVLVAGGAWALGSKAVGGEPVKHAPPTALAETVNAASGAQVVAAPVPEAPAAVPVAPAVEEPAEVVSAVVDPPSPVVASAVPAMTPGSDRYLAPDHCARQGGEVGGWWYVGAEMPGQPGDVIVVPHDAYVRAEVPGTSNGWSTKTPVRCVLYAGDKVRLKEAPVSVPVGAWWVSTSGADVVVAGGQRIKGRG